MYYAIFLLVAFLILGPAFESNSPNTKVMISFVQGLYDPSIVDKVGGKVTEEFKDMQMLSAVIPLEKIDNLRLEPSIEFVETDGEFGIADVSTSEYSESWYLNDIGVEPAHLSHYTGKGVKIAVLDTGVDYKHPDIAPNYKGGYDFINQDNDPIDDNGHGTHVAGILAAVQDGKGIVGVAPDSAIYAIKVSDARGKGSFSGLVQGINWAIDNNMDIVTMSITAKGGSQALAKAIDTAYSQYGLVLVAAVGNGIGDVLYPAAYQQVIGVGSINKDNTLSSFSLTGSEVEFVAPGAGIKSAAIGGEYRLSSGTSMATPLVTGAIALLLGSDEEIWEDSGRVNGDGKWTNDELRKVLRDAAKDLGEKGKDNSFGYGLLNLDFPEQNTSVASPSIKLHYITLVLRII